MLFPTIEFALFFFIVFAISWAITKYPETRKYFLTAVSYFFYGCWDWRFTFLLLFCSAGSYFIGIGLGKTDDLVKRKRLITYSVVINLTVLGFFKYYGFFTSSFNQLFQKINFTIDIPFTDYLFRVHPQIPFLEVILPVGISFFTFHAMSYVIDVYRKSIPPAKSAIDVFFYIAFFPQLVAGPIVRASKFLPQCNNNPDPDKIDAAQASTLIVGGLFKKVVIANLISQLIVDPVFDNPAGYTSLDALFAVYGYAVQIYCDFSAYSDIAIGVAALFGYTFPVNFNQPYRSASIQEFWRRWHISLSSWLRDYLYIPLGGSKGGKFATYKNLAITMLLGGLWHGAAWNFILWGALHGFGLGIERFFRQKFGDRPKIAWKETLKIIFIFHFVCLTWVFFRSSSFTNAWEFLSVIAGFNFHSTMVTPTVILLVIIGVGINFTPKIIGLRMRQFIGSLHPVVQGILIGLVLVAIGAMGPEGIAPFIYFQF